MKAKRLNPLTEIINNKESNSVVIYKHPKMEINSFIENSLTYLVNKLIKENKKMIYKQAISI